MKATIPNIAESAGLSTATVDRVLNNRAGVTAANRQRVMEAAKQLGNAYLPGAQSALHNYTRLFAADDGSFADQPSQPRAKRLDYRTSASNSSPLSV